MPDAAVAWPRKTRELMNHHMDSTVWNAFAFRGDDVVIARAGKPVARLVPYVKAPGGMLLGLARSSALHIPDDAALSEMDREVAAMFAESGSVFPSPFSSYSVQEPKPALYLQPASNP